MTTDQQDRPLSGSEGEAHSTPSDPKHPYGFNKGDQIADRYQVIRPLGFGGFADVYHCQDLRLGRDVAVKVLTETEAGLQEARAAASLEHPHIVQVYDVSEPDDDAPMMVFRYVEGHTLERCLNQAQYRRLPLDKHTLRIVYQVSEALDYAHGEGVIHRDVKPSNIILDPQGNAHLTDFGLAEVKKLEGETMMSKKLQHRLSGTIPYMAPEQLKEETPGDKHSDLYSLAVVVYEMLTGQLPYRGRDVGLIYQITSSEPLPPILANPELPQGAESVLLRALDKTPAKRYSTCQAFADELKKATEAYVKASAQYKRARELFKEMEWREALAAFEALESKAPGFRHTDRYLEQARHQMRLLELYEQAQAALERGKYQDALDTLNALIKLSPDYEIADLRRQAREGLGRVERQSLNERYQQAVKQFGKEEYQACLDTLAVIRERDPSYPDPQEIEAPAREHVDRQQRLRALYARGVDQIGREQWEEAIATFQTLNKQAPGYEDVETRMVMARHMARMSALLQKAQSFREQGAFAACVDELGQLQRIHPNYKQDEVARLRIEALNRLHERAEFLIQERQFQKSLSALAELRQRSSDYPDVDELESKAREGIHARNLKAQLDQIYQQALKHLDQRDYAGALGQWQEIQKRKGDLDYHDPKYVEDRAKDGLCINLYNQALGTLAQKDPHQALKLWRQVREVDSSYPDTQQIEERAQAQIKSKEKTRWWALRIGCGAIALILVGILIAVILQSCGSPAVQPADTPTLTPSVTATPTLTPSPTKAIITRTPSPTPSITPTATGSPTVTPTWTPSPTPETPTPTYTPTPETTPKAVETNPQGSSIYVAPDSSSRVLGGIRAGEEVEVLGRSAYGDWFYVRNGQGVEGFTYAPRFEWSGDYESLPIVAAPFTPVPITRTPQTGSQYTTLVVDLWDIPGGWCSEGRWYKSIFIEGHGGDGNYTYYWNGERIAGPTSESHSFEISSMGGGAVIGTGKAVSGDGQQVEQELYIRVADCAQ